VEMKNCKEIKELIPFYIENSMEQDMYETFEEHMAFCSSCRDELAEITRVMDLCRSFDEVELPVNFREELHKRLVKAAEEQDRHNKGLLPMKKYIRIFSSVAAGLLLVVFIKSFYDFGVFSPVKPNTAPKIEVMEDTAILMENDVAANLAADNSEQNLQSAEAGDVGTLNAPEAFKASASTVRSVGEERKLDAGIPKEQILIKRTNIIVNIEDEEKAIEQAERIKSYALNNIKAPASELNGTGHSSENTSEKEADDTVIIDIKIPNNKYNQFINILISDYGQSNLEIGDIITEDITNKAEALGTMFSKLSDEVHKMENSGDAVSPDMLREKKSKMEATEAEIDHLQLDSEYIGVSITVRKKPDN